MTDFSNLIDWAKRVYPIENYDTYEEWESDVVEDLEDSGHMPKKTDNLFDQLQKFWKSNKKEKPKPRERDITEFAESELPPEKKPSELPPEKQESEIPQPKPSLEPTPIPTPKPKEKPTRPQPKPKKTIGERIKGFFGRFRRKKK